MTRTAAKTPDAKKNRNAERSVRLLESAFLELVAEKPYEKITVTDVTTRADLNRGTFYAHFKSMDELVNAVMDQLTNRLAGMLDQVADRSFLEDPMPVLKGIASFLDTNHDLVQRLVETRTLEPFIMSIVNKLKERLNDFLMSEYGEEGPRALVLADYIAAGVLWTYYGWLSGEYGTRGIDEVTEDLCRLIQGTGKAMV